MKIKILYPIISAFTFCSCNGPNEFYQGKVVDEHDNPIEGVIVAEDNIEKQTRTNKDGYFKLRRSPEWLGDLIFIKEGYKTDTVPSVWHHAGETIEYNFVKDDTTIVRLLLK